MGLLKVARMGHPVLVAKAAEVSPEDLAGDRIQRLIDDMIDTMRDERGVGLAAPQVHESLRLFVMDPGPTEEGDGEGGAANRPAVDPDSGLRVLVDPVLTPRGGDRLQLWEGCLSIPGIRGLTERHAAVEVRYLDRNGREQHEVFEDFPAAVVQHENDHLDGLFFFSRMPDLTRIAFDDELARHGSLDEDEGELPDAGSPAAGENSPAG
ncbi:MAG: peptide deformylase [Gemmatimonadetes bacterium]|nr:peptide deformylase [Gemmatimonadota bacterium]